MKVKYLFLILYLFCFPLIAKAGIQPPEDFDTYTIYIENDSFAQTDRDYTNGVKLTWSTPFQFDTKKLNLPDWSYPIINRLPFVNDSAKYRAVSFSLGQNIYTPNDLERQDLIEEDRPYAGILYVAVGFHSRQGRRKDSWEFSVGIVGPHSYAEQAQNTVHRWIGSTPVKGWDNQLKDELALEVVCESQWRLIESNSSRKFGYDLIPHLGVRLGNVQIYTNGGAEFRVGWNLANDFGTCPIRAGCEINSACRFDADNPSLGWRKKGIHLFFAVDSRLMLRDIFLDGNTFKDSHSVDKENFVADLMAGIGFIFGRFKASYAYVYRTKQFKQQEKEQVFGTLTLSYSY